MTSASFVSPLLDQLLGDAELAAHFDIDAEIKAMLAFETALAEAEAAEGVIAPEAARAIIAACDSFSPDIAALMSGVTRDGVVVPEFVRQLRQAIGEPHAKHAHHGATSQDVIDSALALRLKTILSIVETRLQALIADLDQIAARDGDHALMGRTRMQRARPINVAQKIANWRDPLARRAQELPQLRSSVLVVQFGGAVGNRAELGDTAQAIADRLAASLGLNSAARAWHAQRDGIVALGQWFALIAGQLGKVGVDVALMAQNEVNEIKLASGGGSSAMPDKNNPVAAEILVTLARQTATLAGGLHHALVHENERSGAAWTLEWLLLPPLVIATGAALNHARALLSGVSFP